MTARQWLGIAHLCVRALSAFGVIASAALFLLEFMQAFDIIDAEPMPHWLIATFIFAFVIPRLWRLAAGRD